MPNRNQEEESKLDEPYSINEAKYELYVQNGETRYPNPQEINDWLHERNAPWARDGNYMNYGLPVYNMYAEEYVSINDADAWSYSGMMLVGAAAFGTLYLGRRYGNRNREAEFDDDFKAQNKQSLLDTMKNPFKRDPKKDDDEDFSRFM